MTFLRYLNKRSNRNFIFQLILVIIFITIFPSNLHARTTIKPTPFNKIDLKLKRNEGFLLFYLDTNGISPSLYLRKVSGVISDIIKQPSENNIYYRDQKIAIDLQGLQEGLFALKIKPGAYQITQINDPFYRFPYKRKTYNNQNWRFIVKKQSINFIGSIKILKQSFYNQFHASMKNSFAEHYTVIKQFTSSNNLNIPILNGSGYRDDFHLAYKKNDHN